MTLRTRFIATTGALSALSIVLAMTPLGMIPWFAGASLTTMHIPVIIGAILEGPVAGTIIGLVFGLFGMIRSMIAPQGPIDLMFQNPMVSVLPRLVIGVAAWGVWNLLKKYPVPGIIAAGIAGSLTNTILVLGALSLLNFLPWSAAVGVAVTNGLLEAVAAAIITLAVVSAWKRIDNGTGKSSLPDLPDEQEK